MSNTGHPIAHYELVANLYLEAIADGTSTRTNIQGAFNVPLTTVDRWVKRARQLGLLGARPYPRLDAVAHALNVSPNALRQALIAHANGELRVGRGAESA